MAKNKVAKVKNSKVQNNGIMSDVLGLNSNPYTMTTQLSQADTLFKNNRWYLVSNMRQLLSEIYVEHGLVQTIVDVPVDDGLRGGVEIKSKQLSADEIEELQTEIEQRGDIQTAGQAVKWNRLFGGAAIVVITEQDPSTPLDMEALTDGKVEFRAIDMWELFYSKQNTEDYSAVIDASEINSQTEYYDYYGVKLHHTRVFKMKGIEAPSFIRPRLRGWGVSIIETLVRSINQYLKSNNLIFEVLDEFKIDIYKIKNLANTLMSDIGAAQIKRRISLANQQKNYQNAITMDGEDDFITKELTFTGIAETMTGIRMQIASDMRMPLTKIFGISAAGFGSGEDDIENYNSMVESQVRQKIKFDILKMIGIRCQQIFGYVPDDLTITFKPLRILSAESEETVKTQQFTRILQAYEKGLMSAEEFKGACNKNNLTVIQLDPTLDVLEVTGNTDNEAATKPPAGKKSTTSTPEAKT